MRTFKKIQCLLAFLTISFIFTLPPVWASTGGLPDDDDLRRTMECDWTITNATEPVDPGDYKNDPDDDLVKLAVSLDKDPAKLYAWVYKNVYFPQYQYNKSKSRLTYYKNSRLGARGTYLNRIGNAWDQSSLLVSLLRICGIPARYVQIDQTQKVYVEAYLDLEKYYGISVGSTKDWVPMIPWFKKIDLFDGIDLYPTDGTVTDTVPTGLEYNFTDYLSTLKTESTLDEYESQLQDYLVTNYPGKSVKDISYKETRIDRPAIIPPRSLPLGFSSTSENRFAEIPDGNRTYIKLWFKKADGSNLLPEQTVYLPQIAGKRFVLDWDYSAGTSFKPILKIDGKNFCSPGNALPRDQSFVIKYRTKDNNTLVPRPSRKSGTFIYMGFDPYCASVKTIEKAKQKLDGLSAKKAQRVLNPSAHEEFLGLMGQVLGETWLNRMHVNSQKAAKYFHGTQIWNISPIFVYTKYHSAEGAEGNEFYHPIKADPESKFYYHPQWNIDAQNAGSFLKWDHINNKIVDMKWDAPIYQTMRWLAGYGTSYDESKIFEDWMDTPGASTIKGLMLANEDIHGTGNRMLELTSSDIQTQTTNRTATFETVRSVGSTDPDTDWINPNEAYEGFTFSNVRKVPDGWRPSGFNTPLGSSAINGSYGIAVYNKGESYCFFARGTKFDLKTIKISGFDNRGTKYRFKAYKRTTNPNATEPFVYANLSKDVVLSSTPENVQFNWTGINKVVIIQLTNGNLSMPIVMDNLVYARNEYIPLLDNQTELHLGYASILNIMRELDKGGRVITPAQKIYYEGLEGNVFLSFCPGIDLYAFGMDNGGGAGIWTDPNPSFVDPNDYHFDSGLDTFVSNNIYNDLFGGSSQTTVTPATQVNREQQSWLSDARAPDITLPNPVKNEKQSVLSWVGDPVDSLTGEFYTEEFPDITIKSRGLDLSIVRQYKSQLAYNGPFGFGWTWNHAEKIVPLENGNVNYYNNQGSVFEIQLKNGSYTYPPGSRFTLKKVSGGYLVTQKESGLKSSFNSNGLLTKREDRFGNTLKYQYTNTKFPARITLIKDSLNQALTLTYNNTTGKCETVKDSNGRSVHYIYDGDDLVEYRGLDYDTSGGSTKFEYLSGQQNDLNNHNMVKYTLPGGDSLKIGYYKNDQVAFHTNDKGETFNFFFSRLSRYTEIWNEEGFYRKIYFNANGDAVRNLAEDGSIEQFEYDDYHNKTAYIDGNGFRTKFQYYPDGTGANNQDGFNAQRKLYKKTNALGHVWKYKYDDSNNPHSPSEIEDPEGRITEFVYNADGSLFKEIRAPGFKFDVQGSGGELVADASAPGFITEYEYDAFGNVIRVTDALGNTSTTTYDADGRLPVARTDQNGNETYFAYYEAGNSETMPPDSLKSRTIIEGDETYTTRFKYDASGRKTKEINPLGQATQYQYTLDGKLQKTTYPNGAEAANVYDTARDIAHGAEIVKKIDALGESEQYAYNAIGKLIAKTDRNQNKTTYEYDERGRLAKTTDPLGNTQTVEYDGSGNVVAKTDKRGLTSTFVYDKANRLIKENLPGGTETEPCIATRTYEYYNDGKKKKQTLKISDGNHENIVTFFEYDALGHLSKRTDGYGSSSPRTTQFHHDALGRRVRTVYPLGNYTETEYDGLGNELFASAYDRNGTLLEQTGKIYNSRNLLVQQIDPLGYTTTFAYDGAGRRIETVDGENNAEQYQYDEVGNLIQQSDPLGRITRHVYDLNNQKIKTIDPDGYTTAFAYDPNGNQTAVVWPDQSEVNVFYDALNRAIGRINELDHQELFEYDPAGNLLVYTDAGGNVTTYEYDAANRRVSTIDAKNQATAVAYDEAGRTLQTTDALGVVTDRQYDVHGSLVKLIQALGTDDESVTRYQYDDNNRQTHEIRELKEDGAAIRDLVTQFQYDDRGLLRFRIEGQHLGVDAESTEFRYNAKGELIETIDPEGNLTAYEYDKTGRKIKVSVTTEAGGLAEHTWEYDQAGNVILETLPEGETIVKGYDLFNRLNFELLGTDQRHLEYDARGRLVSETNFNNIITQYEYDAAGRLTAQTDALGTPDEAVTRYTYDENGNARTITNARNKLVSFEYNELNQVIRKTDSDATYTDYTYDANGGVKTIKRQDKTVITYIRDNLGRVSLVKADGSLRQEFAYDTLSRMKSATDNNGGRATHTVDYIYNDLSRAKTETQDSYTVTRQFDGNGNKTRITYPSARVVDKAYDENNMLLEVRYQGSLVAQATYDKNSRLAYAAVGNNTDLSLDYDPDRGRENYRSVTTPYADPLFSVSNMVYDGQNNLTEKTEHSNSSTLNEKLEYDPIDRLTAHNRGAAPAVTWDYDKAGNWTATNQNGTAETRTVTDDNEYNLVGARVPVHDDRGNMTFDCNRSFKYDWSNRLVKITSGSQTLAEYTYDALNRRVTKTVGADTTTYVYDGADVVEAYINGTLARAFVPGGNVDDPILMEYNGQDYYYARDRLGSIRAITDSTGALVESYEYSPFGLMTVFDNQGQDITATGSTIGNPYGYTGRRWDSESGLWYYRNRMYSAELGRFMQRDPAGYVDGLNLYAYVSNNPLQYTDPDGLMARAAYDWTSENVLEPSKVYMSEAMTYYDNKWNNDYIDTDSIIYTSENIIKNSFIASGRSVLELSREFTGTIAVTGERIGSGVKASFQRNELYERPTNLKEFIYNGKDLGINLVSYIATAKVESIEANLFLGEIISEIGTNIYNAKYGENDEGPAADIRRGRIIANDISTKILDKTNNVIIGTGQEVPFFTSARKDISSRSTLNRTEISTLYGKIAYDSVIFVNQWQNLNKK